MYRVYEYRCLPVRELKRDSGPVCQPFAHYILHWFRVIVWPCPTVSFHSLVVSLPSPSPSSHPEAASSLLYIPHSCSSFKSELYALQSFVTGRNDLPAQVRHYLLPMEKFTPFLLSHSPLTFVHFPVLFFQPSRHITCVRFFGF